MGQNSPLLVRNRVTTTSLFLSLLSSLLPVGTAASPLTNTGARNTPSPPSSTPTKRNLDEAERVLREALLSIKRPKLTYHALFLAYLKAGPVYMHKAQQLIIEMKDRGIHPPDQIEVGLTLSYHSHKQVFLPLIHP